MKIKGAFILHMVRALWSKSWYNLTSGDFWSRSLRRSLSYSLLPSKREIITPVYCRPGNIRAAIWMAKMEQTETLPQWFCWLASTQVAFIESINLPFPQRRLSFSGSSMRREPIIPPVTNCHPLTPLHDFQKNVIFLVFSYNRQMR